jgi:recombinational DNA repair ATPase RecF
VNKAPTLQLLRNQFQSVAEVGPEVVRAERQHQGVPFGIFYFDFSQSVARPDFNLSAFVQEQVATDFYKHEGSLQWNYYLYFVLETANFRNLSTPRITAIEADRTFARKYVRDTGTLNRELGSPLSATLHATEQTQDIASRWVKALSAAGLAGIADPSADYAPTIRHYLERAAPPGATKLTTLPEKDAEKGQYLQRLDLGNFRQHPAQRIFDFGRVNLIRGVNGTGKTSLLEAIELCICGANRRQQGVAPPDAKLKLQFTGQDRLQICPVSAAKIYRDRDRSWYGGYYLQGNRLCQNFARFNFFDTDAAVQLSSEASGADIQAAIDTLFLGEFANSIEERMRQSHERFKRELQGTQKELKGHRTTQRKTAEDLARLRAIKDTRETLAEELQAKATACGWKKIPARLALPAIEVLQEAAAAEAENFTQAIRRIRWMPRITVAGLQREAAELAETVTELGKLRKVSTDNGERLEDDRDRVVTLEAELDVIAKIARYHEEPEAFLLVGSGKKATALRSTLDQFREAAALGRDLNFQPFEASTASLKELIESQVADVAKQRRNLGRLKARASELQSQFGKIKAVVEQIKGLGQHFCEVSPGAKSCPLCGTEHADLRSRLASLQLTPELESPLGELTTQIARAEGQLNEAQTALETLQQLQQADELLQAESKPSTRSVKVVIADFGKLSELIASRKDLLDSMLATQKRLRLAGFTETELAELLDTAVHERELPRAKLEKPDSLHALRLEKTKTLDLIRATVKERLQLEKTNAAELRRLHVRRLGEAAVGDPDIEIERRQTTVDDVLATMRSAKRGVEVEEKDEFAGVAARLDAFAKAVARIHEALKRVEEKDALEQSLAATAAETGQAIAKLEPREARAKEALALLDEFLGSSYKDAYLREVHVKLRDKLVTLFSRIHAPHEFSDVVFNGEMRLKRESGSLSPVREISTGQRAALALSIFLSMNSSVSAPWLLFDDPVAHVDDLNILSFLDNLRDLVLVGQRQVFFATANPRIADLFTRKFDCLGSEFKDFRLQR